MAQDVCVIVSAEDRTRLAAVVGDRGRPLKHVQRARIVLLSAERLPVLTILGFAGYVVAFLNSVWIILGYHFAGYSRVVGPVAAGLFQIPYRRWAPLDYAGQVWSAARGLFGGYPPDQLLVWTFWGGFGWLEMSPPFWLISALAGTFGALVAIWAWQSVWRRQTGRAAALLLTLAGLAASLTLYAIVTAWTLDFVHGRYLIGWYLMLLAPAAALVTEAAANRALVAVPVWVALGLVHAVSASTTLDRYFGP